MKITTVCIQPESPKMALHTNAAPNSSRIDWVDYAKGFCIIFVVMMHSVLGVEKYAGDTGWMNAIVTFARPFRMPDFFLISGLFLGFVIDRPWIRYFDRKVVHFAYFYVLWLAINFVIRSVGWVGEGQETTEILQHFVLSLVEPFGVLWFIYMLPVFFIITRLIKRIPWPVVLAAAAVLEILPVHTGSTIIDEFASRYVYFFAGYALAPAIFRLATWARENNAKALAYLGVWMVINGAFCFTAVPQSLVALFNANGLVPPVNMSAFPVISLVLGAAGAIAVVTLCAVLSQFKVAEFLRYLGSNSIVLYLAFFIPMVATRMILLRYAPFLDIGTISLIVTISAVIGPVILFEFTRFTGWGTFLFMRPKWAWIDKQSGSQSTKAALHPAE